MKRFLESGLRLPRAFLHLLEPWRDMTIPANPTTLKTIPEMSISIDLSVGAPVKNRDMLELVEFTAWAPKTASTIPAIKMAMDKTLYMGRSPDRERLADQTGDRPRMIRRRMMTTAITSRM